MKKHDLDNRSRQLNPQDPVYHQSRNQPEPAPAPESPPAPAQGGSKKP